MTCFECSLHILAVSGAHNTIVTSRAGKDLISSLCSGLLTIVRMKFFFLDWSSFFKNDIWWRSCKSFDTRLVDRDRWILNIKFLGRFDLTCFVTYFLCFSSFFLSLAYFCLFCFIYFFVGLFCLFERFISFYFFVFFCLACYYWCCFICRSFFYYG